MVDATATKEKERTFWLEKDCYELEKNRLFETIFLKEAYMSEFTFEIVEEIGVLSENSKGWKKELNLISWNGGEPKYDIRDWDPNHEKMGKGITLSEEEAKQLYIALSQI